MLPSKFNCLIPIKALLVGAILASSGRSFGSGFGCAGVAAEVVFKDTLYGAGTGLLVGGIVEATHDEHEGIGKRLATGTAIGAGVGLVLGIAEVAIRDCSAPSRVNKVENHRWDPIFVMGHGYSPTVGLGWTWNMKS